MSSSSTVALGNKNKGRPLPRLPSTENDRIVEEETKPSMNAINHSTTVAARPAPQRLPMLAENSEEAFMKSRPTGSTGPVILGHRHHHTASSKAAPPAPEAPPTHTRPSPPQRNPNAPSGRTHFGEQHQMATDNALNPPVSLPTTTSELRLSNAARIGRQIAMQEVRREMGLSTQPTTAAVDGARGRSASDSASILSSLEASKHSTSTARTAQPPTSSSSKVPSSRHRLASQSSSSVEKKLNNLPKPVAHRPVPPAASKGHLELSSEDSSSVFVVPTELDTDWSSPNKNRRPTAAPPSSQRDRLVVHYTKTGPVPPASNTTSSHATLVKHACRAIEYEQAGHASLHPSEAPLAPPSAYDADPLTLLQRENEYQRLLILKKERWEWDVLCQMLQMDFVDHFVTPQISNILTIEREARGVIRKAEQDDRDTHLAVLANQLTQWHRDIQIREKHLNQRIARVRALQLRGELTTAAAEQLIAKLERQSAENIGALQEQQGLVELKAGAVAELESKEKESTDKTNKFFTQRLGYESPATPTDQSHRQSKLDNNGVVARATGVALSTDKRQQELVDKIGGKYDIKPAPPPQHEDHADQLTLMKLRNVHLALSDLRPLLSSEAHERGLIKNFTDIEFKEIEMQFTTEKEHVGEQIRRKAHLERLAMWRQQREERELQVRSYAKLQEDIEALCAAEASRRQGVQLGVMSEQDDLLCTCQGTANKQQRSELEVAAIDSKADLIAADYIPSTLRILEQEAEPIARQQLEEWVQHDQVENVLEPHHAMLKKLQVEWDDKRDKIIHIQRTFRAIQLRLAGWRVTHKRIGEHIQHMRATKYMAKQKERVGSCLAKVQAQMAALANEEEAEFSQQRHTLQGEEVAERKELVSLEDWWRRSILSEEKHHHIHRIIMPKIHSLLEKDEPAARLALEKKGWYEGAHAIRSGFLSYRTLLQDKLNFERSEEPRVRSMVVQHEERAFTANILVPFRRIRDDIKVLEKKRATAHAAARAELCDEEHAQRAPLELDMLQELQSIHHHHERFKLTTLDVLEFRSGWNRLSVDGMTVAHTASSSSQHEPDAFFADYMSSFISNFCPFAFQLKIYFGQNSLQITSSDCWKSFMAFIDTVEEHNARNGVLGEEATTRELLLGETWNRELAIVSELVEAKGGASVKIQRFYRAYREGKVGRSGMKRYLKAQFWVKREKAEIRRQQEEQKRQIALAARELDDAIADHNFQTAEEFAVVLKRRERREEYCRNEVATEEQFVRNIIENNFVMWARDITAEAIRNCISHEAYWRTRIEKEWVQAFDDIFEPKKDTFAEDVKIRPAQRAWRCHMARNTLRSKIDGALSQAEQNECEKRLALEREELEERLVNFDRVKAGDVSVFGKDFLGTFVPQALEELNHVEVLHLDEQEHLARLGIVEHLYQTIRYYEIDAVESRQRHDLMKKVSQEALKLLEIEFSEASDREALMKESQHRVGEIVEAFS